MFKLWMVGICMSVNFFFCELKAQQLDLTMPPTLEVYPYFNHSFIKEHKIQTCRTKVLYKIPNYKIRSSKESQYFEMDAMGYVVKIISISKLGSDHSLSFFRNKRGKLSSVYEKDAYKNRLISYQYNENGLMVLKETADAKTSVLVSKEEMTYEIFSEYQFKRFFLNSENLTYKYQIVDLDKLGRIKEARTRFIRGMNKESIRYVYNGDLLIELITNKRDATRREEKYTMEYDLNGLLQVAKMTIDGAPIFRYEYLYEEGLLIAILRKELKTQEIQITKFTYTFYED